VTTVFRLGLHTTLIKLMVLICNFSLPTSRMASTLVAPTSSRETLGIGQPLPRICLAHTPDDLSRRQLFFFLVLHRGQVPYKF
jgi:hypothetical protein